MPKLRIDDGSKRLTEVDEGSERQYWEEDGSEHQTKDVALNAKLKKGGSSKC